MTSYTEKGHERLEAQPPAERTIPVPAALLMRALDALCRGQHFVEHLDASLADLPNGGSCPRDELDAALSIRAGSEDLQGSDIASLLATHSLRLLALMVYEGIPSTAFGPAVSPLAEMLEAARAELRAILEANGIAH